MLEMNPDSLNRLSEGKRNAVCSCSVWDVALSGPSFPAGSGVGARRVLCFLPTAEGVFRECFNPSVWPAGWHFQRPKQTRASNLLPHRVVCLTDASVLLQTLASGFTLFRAPDVGFLWDRTAVWGEWLETSLSAALVCGKIVVLRLGNIG